MLKIKGAKFVHRRHLKSQPNTSKFDFYFLFGSLYSFKNIRILFIQFWNSRNKIQIQPIRSRNCDDLVDFVVKSIFMWRFCFFMYFED
ncbi:hypothetical protein P8452_08376 [Trifolium repens]|nr:hypothetical protein P8452_08376 [Trifolium repens]